MRHGVLRRSQRLKISQRSTILAAFQRIGDIASPSVPEGMTHYTNPIANPSPGGRDSIAPQRWHGRNTRSLGEMAERPIAPVLKTGDPARDPRVRIPVSPLHFLCEPFDVGFPDSATKTTAGTSPPPAERFRIVIQLIAVHGEKDHDALGASFPRVAPLDPAPVRATRNTATRSRRLFSPLCPRSLGFPGSNSWTRCHCSSVNSNRRIFFHRPWDGFHAAGLP